MLLIYLSREKRKGLLVLRVVVRRVGLSRREQSLFHILRYHHGFSQRDQVREAVNVSLSRYKETPFTSAIIPVKCVVLVVSPFHPLPLPSPILVPCLD